MSIKGLGVDVAEVGRIERMRKKWGDRFIDKVFGPEEREYCLRLARPDPSLAARFAAKEAFIKAVGTRSGIAWRDVTIKPGRRGKPALAVSGGAAARLGKRTAHVTLTHTHELAIAMIVIEGD